MLFLGWLFTGKLSFQQLNMPILIIRNYLLFHHRSFVLILSFIDNIQVFLQFICWDWRKGYYSWLEWCIWTRIWGIQFMCLNGLFLIQVRVLFWTTWWVYFHKTVLLVIYRCLIRTYDLTAQKRRLFQNRFLLILFILFRLFFLH